MGNGFDPECLGLAEYFLNADATQQMKYDLAQHIQDAIEDWLYDKEGEPIDPEKQAEAVERAASTAEGMDG